MSDTYQKLNSEELEQVAGGAVGFGHAATAELRPGMGGNPVTADNRFDALSGLTTLELERMSSRNPLFPLAQEYLRFLRSMTGSSSGNGGGIAL